MAKIGIIMGSESDKEIMLGAAKMCEQLEIEYDLIVASAHRQSDRVIEYATKAEQTYDVIIAGAGKAAHLPGVVASRTLLPVIGVPIKTSDLGGLDSLLSIVQMPSGVPVATVAINGSKNAAILAAQIIARYDTKIKENIKKLKEQQAK